MFKDLTKKKKKKAKADDADGDKAVDGADELDMSALKKKKKKKPKADDFDAKLAEVGEGGGTKEAEEPTQEGDMIKGTGIWAHDSTENVSYSLLLQRFFTLLHDRHPDLAIGGGKSYKIPPPQCLREGNKKTIFANLPDIAKRLKRSEEHITSFLFAEMGTSGSTDGSRRLVIKGRFQSKQIENILRRYIQDYVSCKTCKSLNTELAKGENRLWYITCKFLLPNSKRSELTRTSKVKAAVVAVQCRQSKRASQLKLASGSVCKARSCLGGVGARMKTWWLLNF